MDHRIEFWSLRHEPAFSCSEPGRTSGGIQSPDCRSGLLLFTKSGIRNLSSEQKETEIPNLWKQGTIWSNVCSLANQ